MKLNKMFTLKASALAVAAVVAGSAFAAPVDLDAATPVAVKYASEQNVAAAGSTLTGTAAAPSDTRTTVLLGATFATDAVAYVRFDLSNGATFTVAPTLATTDTTPAAVAGAISQGGVGQSYVIFAIAPAAGKALPSTAVTVMASTGIKVLDQTGTAVTYKLFETLTNAANNTLPLKTATASFIKFAPSVTFTATASTTSAIADVAASYKAFTTGTSRNLGSLAWVNAGYATQAGAAITLANILANTSTVTLGGDFSFAQNAAAPLYTVAALTAVKFTDDATCAAGTTTVNAATLSQTAATSAALSAAALTAAVGSTLNVCAIPAGNGALLASDYTGTLNLVANTGYTISSPALSLASITRNGAQTDVRSYIPNGTVGYTSYVRVINPGSSAASVTGQWLYEDGTSGSIVALGSVPGNGATTWTSAQIETAIGAPTVIGNNRPRLRLTAPVANLDVQSFFYNGKSESFATMHGKD